MKCEQFPAHGGVIHSQTPSPRHVQGQLDPAPSKAISKQYFLAVQLFAGFIIGLIGCVFSACMMIFVEHPLTPGPRATSRANTTRPPKKQFHRRQFADQLG
jgi:hypothetical protein